jgi:hypothetical protein
LEDLDSDGALFHAVGVVLQVRLYHVAKKSLAALAGPEVATTQEPPELLTNSGVVQGCCDWDVGLHAAVAGI